VSKASEDAGQESGLKSQNRRFRPTKKSRIMLTTQLRNLWTGEEGQDIAEYAVMLAVILVLVVGTIRLVGSNANNAFSSVASSIQ
jgi:Flp pilus assembly pilin Flp